MRIFNVEGEKLYQEWVLKFCAKCPPPPTFSTYILRLSLRLIGCEQRL